jgi:spore coat polysaccharide biosynthesis predicted glycosyltransferase SpsG
MVGFKVNHGQGIGYGHIRRCLSAAKKYYPNSVFICDNRPNNINHEISKLFPVYNEIPSEVSLLIVDIPNHTEGDVFIEDIPSNRNGIIINHSFGVERYNNCIFHQFVDPAFKPILNRTLNNSIFISLGSAINEKIYIERYKTYSNLSHLNVAKIMQTVGFGILSASTVSLEAIESNLPFICLLTAEDQEATYNFYKQKGILCTESIQDIYKLIPKMEKDYLNQLNIIKSIKLNHELF